MSRENTGDKAMLPDFQDIEKVPFPITGPCFSNYELDSAQFENNSVKMSVDSPENHNM